MNGIYGTTKPATINANEADIFYFYRPSRSTDSPDFNGFKKVEDVDKWLSPTTVEGEAILPGMYNLRLPLKEFGKKGIYTVYIKPKEYTKTVIDTSSLVAFPDVTGIVINGDELGDLANDGALVGYRIEFIDGSTKIISSSNHCEPISQNSNNASENAVRYALTTGGNLIFCTLTPSSSLSFTSNGGENTSHTGENVTIISTKFNPAMIEIEMVEHDAETISTMLEGDQLRNLDTGIITTFNKDGGIYHQARYGNATNPEDSKHYDFKVKDDTNVQYGEEDALADIKDNI